MSTCRNCKHWCYPEGYRFRSTTEHAENCKKIQEKIGIEIDQGSGWDCGGASVEAVETPPDFGCNLFEEYKS